MIKFAPEGRSVFVPLQIVSNLNYCFMITLCLYDFAKEKVLIRLQCEEYFVRSCLSFLQLFLKEDDDDSDIYILADSYES